MLQLLGHLARWIIRRDHILCTGPVLLTANHANSLIDPVIVGLTARQPVRFFAKAPLFETPVLGRLLGELGILPAFGAQNDGAQVRRNEQIRSGAARMDGGVVGDGIGAEEIAGHGPLWGRHTGWRRKHQPGRPVD